MTPINLLSKFSQFNEHWSPKIVAELNGQEIKLAKVKGEFVWHHRDDENEMFLVVKGRLRIDFRTHTARLAEGEMLVVPRGVEHRPVADQEAWILLFEPVATKHTGNEKHAITVENYERI